MKLKKPLLLLASFAVTFVAAFVGSIFTINKVNTWYSLLIKPVFNPPAWVFSPAWTILYILMAIALYLVWRKGIEKKEVRIAVRIFLVQLVLNALWSIVFFGMESPLGALMVIFFLWFMILYTINRFAKVDKLASYLLYPYLAWVSFASVLNYAVWYLNN